MSTLATLGTPRTTDPRDVEPPLLIRVPQVIPRTSPTAARRRRLRREVRWTAQALTALALFSAGLVLGRPARETVTAAEIPATPVAELPKADADEYGPCAVVLKGILPDEDGEEGRHAGH